MSRIRAFWYGSGSADPCLSLLDLDSAPAPDPPIFVIGLQNATKNQCCGSGSGIRYLFDPWNPGSGIGFFRLPDIGSRIPNPYFWELSDNFLGKKFYNSLKIGPNFFLQHFKTKIICNFVKFVATLKVMTTNFFSFFFCKFFWRARVCRPLLCVCRPFMIFEGCLDSNPEYCRSKLARYRLSHPSLLLSHPSLYFFHPSLLLLFLDPGSGINIPDPQHCKKLFFSAYLILKVHLHHFQGYKVTKKSQNRSNQGFFYFFLRDDRRI